MKTKSASPLDLKKLDAKLRAWRKKHNTPTKVAAAHRKVLVERVSQSMTFENEPVSTDRLKTLLSAPKSATRIGAPRTFDTAERSLPYTEVSERLAFSLAWILDGILQTTPDQITITVEWMCLRHQELAGRLFPAWAGRLRDVNVQVGAHTPPPFYEVPALLRLFCDDLAERLRHVRPRETRGTELVDLLAWADWRFQWIHPFKDFNGRIGRVVLAALLYKLALPHVETAPLEADTRRQYLEALHAADDGNLGPLTNIWLQRIGNSL